MNEFDWREYLNLAKFLLDLKAQEYQKKHYIVVLLVMLMI